MTFVSVEFSSVSLPCCNSLDPCHNNCETSSFSLCGKHLMEGLRKLLGAKTNQPGAQQKFHFKQKELIQKPLVLRPFLM